MPCRIGVFSGRKCEIAPRKSPPNGDFFVFSHGDFSPRHTEVRYIPCVAFSLTVCRIFAWQSERSPCANPPKSPLCGFRVATLRPAMQRYDTSCSKLNLTDKRESPRKHSLHKKTAASVLLKLFINRNE